MISTLSFVLTITALFSTVSAKSLVPQESSHDRCPPYDDIDPCYCYVDDETDVAMFRCERTSDLEQLKKILGKTKGYSMSAGFFSSRLGDIPSDFFVGQIIQHLHFEKCRIESFGEKPFTGLEDTLEGLFIYGSVHQRRKDFEVLPLEHLRKLKYFTFENNDIKKLGNEWFEGGPSSLEQISLEENDIEILEDKAFASLVNLKQIWLGDNAFKVVSRSMFPKPANKLEILEISHNGIEALPADIFSDMPSLTVVSLSGNKLQTIEESTWRDIWGQLRDVYVGRNPLVCDEKLKWIYTEDRKLPLVFLGKCAGNNELSGKYLENLSIEDFQ